MGRGSWEQGTAAGIAYIFAACLGSFSTVLNHFLPIQAGQVEREMLMK